MKTAPDTTAPLILSQTVKRAWIRCEGYPVGQPAPGYFRCGCGRKVDCPTYGQREPVTCPTCGTIYNGHGWILNAAPI